jgi:prepilin-type N-terminal cleavage/methylation domain-containing protein
VTANRKEPTGAPLAAARRDLRRPRRGERGFTITELLVAIILFGIVSIAMYNLLFSQNRFFDTEEAANATQQNTRIALKRLANDILLVGGGVNTLSLDNPDVVVPNDGTVPVNVRQTDAITLISIPTNVPTVPFATNAARGARTINVVDDSLGMARGLNVNQLILIHDTNLSSSQVLNVAAVTDEGATVKVDFNAADSLLAGYPRDFSRMYTLNVGTYRLNDDNPARPYLEQRLNGGPWTKMIPGIESLTFTYYDGADVAILPTTQALRREIRKVRVDLGGRSVRPVDNRGTHVKMSMSTEVTPRNMME